MSVPDARPATDGLTTGLVLGIDTSVDVRAGLARDGVPIARAGLTDTRAHAEQLMPVVQALMTEAGIGWADLDAVAVGLGPGPFTGLRVGVATAQTIAFAIGVPWRGVCGLDVLAAQYLLDQKSYPLEHESADFLTAVDARRREVYWARHDSAGRRVDGPHVGRPDELPDLPVIGPGAPVVPGRPATDGPRLVDPALMAARNFPDVGLEPLYLRRPDAQEPGQRKSTLPRLLPKVAP